MLVKGNNLTSDQRGNYHAHNIKQAFAVHDVLKKIFLSILYIFYFKLFKAQPCEATKINPNITNGREDAKT